MQASLLTALLLLVIRERVPIAEQEEWDYERIAPVGTEVYDAPRIASGKGRSPRAGGEPGAANPVAPSTEAHVPWGVCVCGVVTPIGYQRAHGGTRVTAPDAGAQGPFAVCSCLFIRSIFVDAPPIRTRSVSVAWVFIVTS
jgi:hypothetical protein